MVNQYKPLPPLDDIREYIEYYWRLHKTEKEIVRLLNEKHIDTSVYGLGLSSFKKMRRQLGLYSTREQAHTMASVHRDIMFLRDRFPKAGAREMVKLLDTERGKRVSRAIVIKYFRTYEPELVKQRKGRKLRRRRFWAAGVNDMWAIDQHDKWKRFGLALHTGIDPFAGEILWMKVWWTNSNPKLITSYYLDFVELTGYMPLITQSDPGSENYGVANSQTLLRHRHDPRLEGTIQHRWMRSKKNVKPEVTWSQMRRMFAPGFEDILDKGVNEGWYDMSRPLDLYTFRWLFIPWLQVELDSYVYRRNFSSKRADKNKILPHGPPDEIYNYPENYDCRNFRIKVDPAYLDEARRAFAPQNDPVFQLTPIIFHEYASVAYHDMGSPAVTYENVWDIYRALLARLEQQQNEVDGVPRSVREYAEELIQQEQQMLDQNQEIPYPLVEGMALAGGDDFPREDGTIYMGGLNGGLADCEFFEKIKSTCSNEKDSVVAEEGDNHIVGDHDDGRIDEEADEELDNLEDDSGDISVEDIHGFFTVQEPINESEIEYW